jgi:hypothetical protein
MRPLGSGILNFLFILKAVSGSVQGIRDIITRDESSKDTTSFIRAEQRLSVFTAEFRWPEKYEQTSAIP